MPVPVRNNRKPRFNWLLASAIVLCAGICFAATGDTPGSTPVFESDVRPILRAYCLDCHGADPELKGGLDLRLRRFIARGGKSGPAIEPGRPDRSLMIERLRSGEMPPEGKPVPPEKIEVLEAWIRAGAKTARAEPESIGPGIGITEEERSFWSFQPIARVAVPDHDRDARVRTPIDALLLSRLGERGLSFSPDADRATLIRRAHLDLLGLPPDPETVREFVRDSRPDAYERLIDVLLASPHYGERWGRHWLDIAGYADSEGYTSRDDVRPYAYKFRDYVIRSLNQDKAFDQFIVEQLAGDELVPQPYRDLTPDQIDRLTATGFLRMSADGTGSGANDDAARNQVIADTLRIVSTSLLGLSVGCAQCHDHRYDPIPQKDYYQLRAVFEPAFTGKAWKTPAQRRISLYTDADRERAERIEAEAAELTARKMEQQNAHLDAALEQELLNFDESIRDRLRTAQRTRANERTPEQLALLKRYPSVQITPGLLYQYNQKAADELKEFDRQIAAVRARKPVEDFLRVLFETSGHAPETRLLHRGDFRQPKEAVAPAALTITAPPKQRRLIPENVPDLPTTGRRLAFARWLVSGNHPLFPRVMVNRIWMHHFGIGLVGTPDDFGALGQAPVHPDLLDWLAGEFIRNGWSLKEMHRLIMTSTVYRQASAVRPDGARLDPANRLYWRKPIQRLDAEVIRDAMMFAGGDLSGSLFGPPTPVRADEAGQIVEPAGSRRRSVYLQVRRTQPVSVLTAFDAPVMEVHCAKRPVSTDATQSLLLMNSDFILHRAEQLADRAWTEPPAFPFPEQGEHPDAMTPDSPPGLAAATARAFELAYSRPPSFDELRLSLRFVSDQIRQLAEPAENSTDRDPVRSAFTNLCQALLGSNEFLYVD